MSTILIIDDNSMIRELLSELLSINGYRVISAANGKEALDKITEVHPDLIITDLLMPTMDGYEFVEELRKKEEYKHISVIFLTATYALPEAALLAKSCGAQAVLAKPADNGVILEVVKRALNEQNLLVNAPFFTDEKIKTKTDSSMPHTSIQEQLTTMPQSLKAQATQLEKEYFPDFIELTQHLVAERTPEKLLKLACEGVRKLVGASYSALGIYKKGHNKILSYYTSMGKSLTDISPKVPEIHKGLLKKISIHKKMIKNEIINAEINATLGLPQELIEGHLLLAPLITVANSYGFLILAKKKSKGRFLEEDLEMVKLLIKQLSSLYEGHHLYDLLQKHAANLQLEISSRKKLEASLNTGESIFRQFSENVSDVFWVMDPLGKINYVSPAFVNIWGKPLETLYANPDIWFDEIAIEDRQQVKKTYKNLLAGNKNLSIEYKVQRPDGTIRYIYDRGFPILNADGKLIHVLGIATDITERKKADKRFETQYIVTQILAESLGLKDAAPKVLRLLCENFGWKLAALWMLEQPKQELHCVASFHTPNSTEPHLDSVQEEPIFSSGIGLPGRVLKEKRAIWIADIKKETKFADEFYPKKDLVHGVCGFPIISKGEVLGVIEFFSDKIVFLDEELFKLMTTIGSQLGLFIQKKHTEAQLEHMASHDILTGLDNRSALFKNIREAITAANDKKCKVAILFLDLDKFKFVNDNFGHEVGDALLKVVGERLRARVRKPDSVARLGGDEFVIVLSEINKIEAITSIAKKILEILATPFAVKGHDFNITTSIGISVFPEDAKDARALLSQADIAMYQAKEAGGNNFQFCTLEMLKIAQEKTLLEEQMKRALQNDEFVLLYQPKYELHLNKIIGVEALLYWKQNGKILSPMDFLPLAEETGLIVSIGAWVLKTACAQIKEWQQLGLKLSVAVNLSSKQLMVGELLETITDVLQTTQLAPEDLELEITEEMLMHNVENGAALICALKKMGVQVAIDDFGTGFSSLMYLKRFKVNHLKIDRSFVNGMPKDAIDVSIGNGIIALSHSLGIKVIAEGVETKEQLDFLVNADCDEMQGYYLSRPLPAEKLTPFLQAPHRLLP